MDWDKWADDMFESCVDGIKKTDPVKSPREWKFFWELLLHWKTYKEEKVKNEKKRSPFE